MSSNSDVRLDQLRQTCQFSKASWAVWLHRNHQGLELALDDLLDAKQRRALHEFLAQSSTINWVDSSLTSGRDQFLNCQDWSTDLACQHVFCYPAPDSRSVLLVGADRLSRQATSFWRVLALDAPFLQDFSQDYLSDRSFLPPSFFASLVSDLDTHYDAQNLFDWVTDRLNWFTENHASYLAVRSGNTFRVVTTRGYANDLIGRIISSNHDSALTALLKRHDRIKLDTVEEAPEWLLATELPQSVGSALGMPIVIGKRVIGMYVCVNFNSQAFPEAVVSRLGMYLDRISHAIEIGIIMADIAHNMQQFALITEIATAASAGTDIEQVARRIVRRLRRTFKTNLVAIWLPDNDPAMLRDYGADQKKSVTMIPVATSLVGYVYETGVLLRLGDISLAPRYLDEGLNVQSALAVPLKYRGKIIGTIAVESQENNTFSLQDEQLLVVIASHLAALLENLHLNQETRLRANNLSLIHQVLQGVVGLTNETEIAKVAADLIARVFHFEFVILLVKDPTEPFLYTLGVGGLKEDLLIHGQRIPVTEGITGKVYRTGESVVSPDISQDMDYLTTGGWTAGSELCVPLKDGDHVFGVLNLEREEKHSFSDKDLPIFESLAAILSSVIMNARRYQELQARIKAQREAEIRLIRSARLAAIGEMAAGIAHELNNPLTTVMGFVELALDELPPDFPQYQELKLVLDEARRAHNVVRRLLDFARQSENVLLQTDINSLVNKVVALFEHVARTNGVEIQVTQADDLTYIWVDPNQIQQVLFNLIQNALQAMPGGGCLQINTLEMERSNRSGIAVSIRDNGHGIAPEIQARIFDPFFTTRPVGAGTGLGLSVSYGIVTDHEGYIDVESQANQGSRFTVWLPVKSRRQHD